MADIFALVLLLVVVVSSRTSRASEDLRPELNLATNNITILANGTLDIECAGYANLQWIYPKEWAGDLIHLVQVRESYDPSRKKSYVSHLLLENIQYEYTGWYICAYQNWSQPDIENYEQDIRSAGVYVYVYDKDYLFVPKRNELVFLAQFVYSSRPLVIPCRPTKPDIKVTFVNVDYSEGEVEGVKFDPRRGFVVEHPWNTHDGHFQCTAEYAGKQQNKTIMLKFQREITLLPKPYVNLTGARHPSVNESFYLICSTIIDDNTILELTWTLPPGVEDVDVLNKTVIRKHLHGESLREVSRRLEVSRATAKHSGTYTCSTITQNRMTRAEQRVEIFVHDKAMSPYVNLTSHAYKKLDVNTTSKDLKLVVEFDYHHSSSSSPLDVQATWIKDGSILDRTRTNTTISRNQIVLRINPVQPDDSGNYTLMVRVGGEEGPSANWSIEVFVKAKPRVFIPDLPSFFVLNQTYNISCIATGYPRPLIWWRWRRGCVNGSTVCDQEWTDVDAHAHMANNATVSALSFLAFNKLNRVMILVANESGYYKCQSNGDPFPSEKVFQFVVAEDRDGMDMLGRAKDKNKIDVIEGQSSNITCRASKAFSGLFWTRHNRTDGERRVTNFSDQGVEIREEETPYSMKSILIFHSLKKSHQGQYSCKAISSDNSTHNRTRTIVVKERTAPHFEDKSSPVSQSIVRNVADTLEFSCKHLGGTPTPNITWFKDNKVMNASALNGIKFLKDNTMLEITRIMENDIGMYSCKVENGVGQALWRNFTLEVKPAEPAEPDMTKWVYVGVFTILAPVLLGVVTILIFKICKEKREREEQAFLEKCLFDKGQISLLNPEMSLDEQVDLLPYHHKWEFPKDRLKLGRVIGQGAFGRVVRAEAIGIDDSETHTTVAVKMLKERADRVQRRALVAELKILIHLGSHLNIVNLLGAVTKNLARGELMVIVEYCRFGNIRNYLLRHRSTFKDQLDPVTGRVNYKAPEEDEDYLTPITSNGFSNPSYQEPKSRLPNLKLNYAHLQHSHSTVADDFSVPYASPTSNYSNSNPWDSAGFTESGNGTHRSRLASEGTMPKKVITTCDLLCFGFQCARGMEYLATRKLIHRDLAARNILLAEDNVVKICDFGLAKDCYKYDTYVKKNDGPLPIKWMAIESIGEKVFTTKSDVWSFGVLLWEFFTLGGNPYPGVELDEDFYRKLKNGYRMEKPKYAPNDLYSLMNSCWQEDPLQRPSFDSLGDALGSFLESGVRQYYLELNTPYLEMNFENPPVDYLAMEKEGEKSGNYQNLDPNTAHYDNISNVRPVDGQGPAPLQPLEVVPMIQLEPPRETKSFRKPLSPPRSISEDPELSIIDDEDDSSVVFEEQNAFLDPKGDNHSAEDYVTMGKVHLERFHKGNESLRSAASSGFHSDLETTPEVVSSMPPSYSLVMDTAT